MKRKKTFLVVGSNPTVHNTDPGTAFVGSRSGKRVIDWLAELDAQKVLLTNVADIITPGNRPLRVSEYDLPTLKSKVDRYKPNAVLALGKTAADALRRLDVEHYELPHPSGRNRKLNDPSFIVGELAKCRRWIDERLLDG